MFRSTTRSPPQVQNGGQIVIVQTRYATLTGTPQLQQQFTISRVRALKTGRIVVVCLHQRQHGPIAPDGAVRSQLKPRMTDIAPAEVRLVEAQAPAARYGALIRRTLGWWL